MSAFLDILQAALRGAALGRAGAREAMGHLVSGEVPEVQIAAFLGAVGGRGAGFEELLGFAEALRERSLRVPARRAPLVDTCGTGGDGLDTFNVSTAAALAAAGAGAAVAKHGNRSSSSRCGSADVLEALGAAIEREPEQAAADLDEGGFTFLFAPRYHPAMRHVGPARRALKARTVFNLLGPLANPAAVARQVVGVSAGVDLRTYAEVLLALGAERVLVARAEDGMDELSLSAPTRVVHGDKERGLREEAVGPEDAGLSPAPLGALRGGDAAQNAGLLEGVLTGRRGPLFDATVLNAAAALLVAGLAGSLREGAALAEKSLASGAARAALGPLRRRPV